MDHRPEREIDLEFEFVRFAREGDVEALARVFDATAPGLLSVARHLARGAPEAEDLVQQTYVTAIERASAFDASRSLLAWLTGILALHARKHARNASRAPDPDRLPAREIEDPHRAAQGAEIASAVERAVGELPERYASVLRLHLVDQLVPREIARRMGIEPGTARVQLHRGLQMLRESLPAGFGGYAGGAIPTSGAADGLMLVRAAVLKRGTQHVAVPAPLPVVTAGITPAIGLLVAATLLLVLVGIGGFAMFGGRGDEITAALAATAGPALVEPASPAHALADPGGSIASASSVAPSRTDIPVPPAIVRKAQAHITGRLLLPSGRPAVGVEVELRGARSNSQRVIAHPPPADWKDPASVRTDADGRFTLEVDPPLAFQFSMYAQLAGHARLAWRWSEIAPNARVDVGERSFEPACTIEVRVLGTNGYPMTIPFQVSANPVRSDRPLPQSAVEPIYVHARYDEERKTHVLEGVPPGPTEVRARSDMTDWLEPRTVSARSAEPARVDLVYSGPDPSRRIVVAWTVDVFHTFEPMPQHIRLSRDGSEPRTATLLERTPSTASFDDVAPGSYTVEIDDPRFVRFVQVGVEPGTEVRPRLQGSAALKIALMRDGRRIDAQPERLTIVYPNSTWTPNEFDLLHQRFIPLVDDYFTGIVPGVCELRVGVRGYPDTRVAVGELRAGERHEVDVELRRAQSLRGVVLDAEGGKPAVGVVVLLTRGSESGHGLGSGTSLHSNGRRILAADLQAVSGDDGRFAFEGLQPGAYTLRAAWSEWLYLDRAIEIGDGSAADATIVAPPSGRLQVDLDLPEGAQHDGVELALRPAYVHGVVPRQAWIRTFGRGAALVPGTPRLSDPLPPGNYEVGATVRARALGSNFGERTVAVVDGRVVYVRLDLRRTMPGRILVRVRADGQPLTRGSIEIVRHSGEELGITSVSIDADGTALLGNVAPGRVDVVFRATKDGKSWTDGVEREIEPGAEIALDLDVPVIEKTLVLRDATGGLLVDQELNARAADDTASPGTNARTDPAGRVKLRMLPGPVILRVGTATLAPIDWSADLADPHHVRLPAR